MLRINFRVCRNPSPCGPYGLMEAVAHSLQSVYLQPTASTGTLVVTLTNKESGALFPNFLGIHVFISKLYFKITSESTMLFFP